MLLIQHASMVCTTYLPLNKDFERKKRAALHARLSTQTPSREAGISQLSLSLSILSHLRGGRGRGGGGAGTPRILGVSLLSSI